MTIVKRGEIHTVDFGEGIGSEQSGARPALIIQNDLGNKYGPTTIVAPITSQLRKKSMPTHISIPQTVGLETNSIVLLEQIRVIDKTRIKRRICVLDQSLMKIVDKAIKISIGL